MTTLIDLVESRASNAPNRRAFTFLHDGEEHEEHLTFATLARQGRVIGAALQDLGVGYETVLLLFPPGLDFVTAFFGAMYAGAIAVPVYPPDPSRLERSLPRFLGIAADARSTVVLTTEAVHSVAGALLASHPSLSGLRWVCTDRLDPGTETTWKRPSTSPDDVAFLQYTSGSTSNPRGVMVTHANTLANQTMIATAMSHGPDSIGVSWLPTYHDMGLVGHVIQPLHLGVLSVLMSPISFLQKPSRWLRAISKYRGTTSGGPNFAFDLCARKITAEEIVDLDLSSWRVAYCGAEPIRAETLERFAERFEPAGFRRDALFPCYGLAEATLAVSGGPLGRGPTVYGLDRAALETGALLARWPSDTHARLMVGCGQVVADAEVRIVDPATGIPSPPEKVGEIWLRSPSIAKGYWNRPEETRQVFEAALAGEDGRPFLRTGDLGFMRHDDLVCSGRIKDLVIIGGKNHYPQDIEHTVEKSHPSLRRGCSAAFAVEKGGGERLVVVAEVERRQQADRRRTPVPPPGGDDRREDKRRIEDAVAVHSRDEPPPFEAEKVIETIRRAVFVEHDLSIFAVVLIKAGSLPKTSSGKVQRHRARESYNSGEFDSVATWMSGDTGRIRPFVPPRTPEETVLARIWQELLNVERVGATDNFLELGGDSVIAVQAVWRAREEGFDVTPRDLLECETLDAWARVAASRVRRARVESQQNLVTGYAPVTPSQMWLLDQPSVDPTDESEARLLLADERLDVHRLAEALEHVLLHHDVLRAQIERDGPRRWSQRFVGRDAAQIIVSREDVSSLSAAQQAHRLDEVRVDLQATLSLSTGPLAAAAHVAFGPNQSARVWVIVHRIAVDAVSWRILLDDMVSAYEQLDRGEPVTLPPKTTAYKNWALRLHEFGSKWDGGGELEHWCAELEGADRPWATVDSKGSSPTSMLVRLGEDDTHALMHRVPANAPIQPPHLVLAAFARALCEWTRVTRLVIDVQGQGRDEIIASADVSRTVGRFTTVFPVALDVTLDARPQDVLRLVRRKLRAIPRGGVGYGLLRHTSEHASAQRLRELPQPKVSFAYLGQQEIGPVGSGLIARTASGLTMIGSSKQRYPVSASAAVSRGELELRVSVDPGQLHGRSLSELVETMVDQVRVLVAFGLSDEARAPSPSDFPRASAAPDQLSEAFKRAMASRKG